MNKTRESSNTTRCPACHKPASLGAYCSYNCQTGRGPGTSSPFVSEMRRQAAMSLDLCAKHRGEIDSWRGRSGDVKV